MLKKILPVIIITVCLLFAGCKAPADQEQKNNTETAVLSTETQEEEWKQVHSTQKDLEKLPQKIQKIFSDNQTFFDVEKEKRKNEIEYVIKLCELDNLLENHPYDLSGGEQQRVAIARAVGRISGGRLG